jgi:cytochrome c553
VRKPLIILAAIALVATLSYCSSSKKASSSKRIVAYDTDIAPIMETQCAPCHIPAKKGNKKPYDNLANVKADIDEILMRVQLDSTDKKFMPKKKPKLDDATIATLKAWKEGGMLATKP